MLTGRRFAAGYADRLRCTNTLLFQFRMVISFVICMSNVVLGHSIILLSPPGTREIQIDVR